MDDKTYPGNGEAKSQAGASGESDVSSVRNYIEDDTINLADYLRVISKHRKMIFRVCAVTVIITTIVSIFLPKSFSATTSVVPPIDVLQSKAELTGGLGGVKSDLLRKAMDITSIADMYVGILKSRSIADAIIERFDLSRIYRIKNDISAVRQTLQKRTSIKVTDEGIIAVTVEDRDPCRAAALANAYIEELDRQNKRLFVGQAASKKVFLENRLREIQAELSNIDNIPSREARIKEMLFELLTKEYEIAKIEEAKSMPTIQVLDSAVVPEKKFKPKRTQMVLLAGITALFVSVFVAFVREHFAQLSLDEMKS
jgi:uncharacterized protein involved in exopolysaccharide biosynthesis